MVTQKSVDLVFKALSDPTRRSILSSLQHRAMAVATVAKSFPRISRPAISKHLRILREAGLVTEDQQGRQRFYRFVGGSLEDAGLWVESFSTAGRRGERRAEREKRRPAPQSDQSVFDNDWRVW